MTNESIELTPREKQVLELLLTGKTNAEIGRILFISRRTVEIHRANIYKKLEVPNYTQLLVQRVQEAKLALVS